MTRRVHVLLGAHFALIGALVTAAALRGSHGLFHVGPVVPLAAFAAAFALVGMLPMHLEYGRSACTLTLVEAVMVLALLTIDPAAVVLAIVAGELAACVMHHQRSLKITYNTASTAVSAVVGAMVFSWLHTSWLTGRHPWPAALIAILCYSTLSHISTSAVLKVVEERQFVSVFWASAPMAGVATMVSVSIGLTAAALFGAHAAAPLLLAPLIFTVGLETRRVAAHRAEHLRFERLYAASGRTAGLQGFEAALAVSAAEARSLVTGAIAVCCAPDRDGVWRGMWVDDDGSRPADQEIVAEVVALVEGNGASELGAAVVPASVRAALPEVAGVVLAGSAPDAEARVGLAVFRDIRGDDQGQARSEVLAAFVGHAALTTTNARLYEDVEEALRRQVDLNRQKDDFLAAVSHELRTPLAAVLGSVATLRRLDSRLDAAAKEGFHDMAARQGKRLQRLIEELLLIAAMENRAEGCITVPVELGVMLTELAGELGDLSEGRVEVAVAPGAERVQSDATKLRQVLVNLVENAAKYAPEGRIDVMAWPSGPDGSITVAIVDHGPGIPVDQRDRVFERFVQLDQSSTRTRGGTGLGLYLCRRLAELIDASLELTDTPGGGCTFTLGLNAPIAELTMPTDRMAEESLSAPVPV